MANRKDLPTGSKRTGRQESETQRHEMDYKHLAETRERAGHRVTSLER